MPDITDKRRRIRGEGLTEFVMSFVDESDKMRCEFLDRMQESIENYMVVPYSGGDSARDKDFPLDTAYGQRNISNYSQLKGSDSHQVVETLLGGVMVNIFGESGFVQARRTGFEDTFKASTVTRLLEYGLTRHGIYRTMYQWAKDGFILGTGIIHSLWDYEEFDETVRFFDVIGGVEVPVEQRFRMASVDDPTFENVDLLDFYPDPGQPRMSKMRRCVRSFRMTAREALDNARTQDHWDMAAVRRAISNAGKTTERRRETHEADRFDGLDRPQKKTTHPDYISMEGYEFWGEVPWNTDGDTWQVITVLNGEQVAYKDEWPLMQRRLPFHDFTVNPMTNRFYGLSPLEVGRYSQDFIDTILSCAADAVIKSTHPAWIVSRNARIKLQHLQSNSPDQPIMTDDMSGVSLAQYNPNLNQSFGLLQHQEQSMKARSGASDVEQGLGFGGVPRTASAATIQARKSATRPENIAQFIEKDSLPPVGMAMHKLFQQFIEGTDDLKRRIGEQEAPVSANEIMSDHDFRFVGSRQEHNKQSRIEAMERAAATIGQLPVAPMFPWAPFMTRYLRDLDLHELEAFVADPEKMLLHTALGQAMQGGGNAQAQNGVASTQSPAGLLPAQAAGGQVV